MRLIVAAVGTRTPAWVDAGFQEYARRMPRELPVKLVEIKPEPRTSGKTTAALAEAEAGRIEAALTPRSRLVALDERGADVTTRDLAARLRRWMEIGDEVAFAIGGPDGLAPRLRESAAEILRLSSLTLPHALVRVLLAEQLYRAASMVLNHPYHRDSPP
jgi:23S rRNA (pseudouridine1915-N3)-methyltransferase